MQTQNLENFSLPACWATIGVFDGVHFAHQQILQALVSGAHRQGLPAVLVTFSPHPATILTGADVRLLTMPDERAELVRAQGVDQMINLAFDHQLADQSAETFMQHLSTHLGLKNLLIGYDFALGKGRAGNFSRLQEIGQQLGYTVQAFDALSKNSQVISSTSIRQDLAVGLVDAAAQKLGRLYRVSGLVVAGDGRGRTIGIPTANLKVPAEKAIPGNGVYACWVDVDGQKHQSVVNIGVRPTFTQGENQARIEAHLLDFAADLYGKTISLDFVVRLRGEQKFSSVDALITQIQSDIARAREIFG